MSNPFDDTGRPTLVLINDEGVHSLWPEHLPVPAGRQVAFGAARRQECLDHIDRHWTDMRPRSVSSSTAVSGPASPSPSRSSVK